MSSRTQLVFVDNVVLLTWQIAVLGETTGLVALGQMRARMLAHPVGREILQEKPRVTEASLDLDHVRKTARAGSLGHAYVSFMDSHR